MRFTRRKILTLAFAMEGGALLVALALARYFDISLFPVTADFAGDILSGTIAAVPPFALFLFTISEKAEKVPLLGSLRNIMTGEIKDVFSECSVFDLAVIALLAGIAEEFLFRGVIQVKLGIVAASIIFGLFHSVSIAYAVVTMVMGFYIGFIFRQSGSLLVPVHLHFIYDLCALLYLKYFIKTDTNPGPETNHNNGI